MGKRKEIQERENLVRVKPGLGKINGIDFMKSRAMAWQQILFLIIKFNFLSISAENHSSTRVEYTQKNLLHVKPAQVRSKKSME